MKWKKCSAYFSPPSKRWALRRTRCASSKKGCAGASAGGGGACSRHHRRPKSRSRRVGEDEMPFGGHDWLALTPEAALEPELPICDPHHHFWDKRLTRLPHQR